MILPVVGLLVRCLPGCLIVPTRHPVPKDAGLVVVRHENRSCRRLSCSSLWLNCSRSRLSASTRSVVIRALVDLADQMAIPTAAITAPTVRTGS